MNPMKKNLRRKSLVALALAIALMVGLFCVPAYAASSKNVTAQLSPHYTIVVDGVERTFYNVAGDEVHPIVYNGTTYLPLRAIGELMDKNVNWDQSTKTATLYGSRGGSVTKGTPDRNATKQSITASLRYDFTIVVDGEERTFTDVNGKTVYPLLYNGSTYLPLRAIGNLMGKTVAWDGKSCTATLGDDDDLLVTDADSFEQSGTYISKAEAKEIALDHAGLSASQVTFVYVALKSSGGQYVYEVEFYRDSNDQEYDYLINASNGRITGYDYDAEHYNPSASSGEFISKDEAKEIALEHANLTASQVTFVYVELDYDNGDWEYEVEFYRNNTEYDYEIDAYTGKILSWDHDAEHHNTTDPDDGLISESKAKEIALDHAGLTSSQVKFVHVKLDYDDGRWEYEVEFYRNNTEYDYEIDASTGKILSYDYDAEYYTPSSGFISESEAKDIALERAGLKENQIKSYKCELDEDDGRWVYEIEFRHGSHEYELEIDAATGAVRSYEKDWD